MKYLPLILLSFLLSSCQGLDIETDSSDSNLQFNVANDLSNKILFSDELLRRDIQDGFILRIDEEGSNLKEIAFVNNNANEAIFGDYSWELVNDKLQVNYPKAITCTTTKTEEPDDFQFDSKVSCSGGSPENAEIEGLLIKPISLRSSQLSNETITITLEDNSTETLVFDNVSDESFTYTIGSGSPRNGMFKQSTYDNVVRIEYTDDSEYSLFILLSGSITDGTLLDLRFTNNTDDLKRIRIYSLSNNNWKLEEERDAINNDNNN